MAIYGYVRISTPKQNIERQVRNIKNAYPAAVIVKEVYTGTSLNRKEWNNLYKRLHEGDTVVFDSVSRMSRSASEGMQAYQELYTKGVNLIFLKEPYINTDTYKQAIANKIQLTGTSVDSILKGVNEYLLAVATEQVRIAFEQSEKEVQDLHQRTKEGIETARLHGKQIGQRQGAKLTTKKGVAAKAVILKHSKDFGGTLDDSDVIKLAQISRNTYYKYKGELRRESGLPLFQTAAVCV